MHSLCERGMLGGDRRTENGRGNDVDDEIKITKDGYKRVGAEIGGT